KGPDPSPNEGDSSEAVAAKILECLRTGVAEAHMTSPLSPKRWAGVITQIFPRVADDKLRAYYRKPLARRPDRRPPPARASTPEFGPRGSATRYFSVDSAFLIASKSGSLPGSSLTAAKRTMPFLSITNAERLLTPFQPFRSGKSVSYFA